MNSFYNAYIDSGLFGLQFSTKDYLTVKPTLLKALEKLSSIKLNGVTDTEFMGALKKLRMQGVDVEGVKSGDVKKVVEGFGKASVCCVGPDTLPWADELKFDL